MNISVKKMLYIFFLLLIFPGSRTWFFDKTESNEKSISNNYNRFNPVCWVKNCQKNEGKTEFTLDPRCWFTECDKKKNVSFNPYCWFANCEENGDESLWLTDEQIINWGKAKVENIKCWFKKCPKKEEKIELTTYGKIKEFFNDLKLQKTITENFWVSEWSPYCWNTECCSKNSIPSNTTVLRQLMSKNLYGQHLTETVVDAINAHWNLNIKPAKALVFSFHGSVGVGKNYLTSLIARSIFKLGMKSRYLHYFTGRIDFTLDKDTDIYRQNLYSWLRSNVTECPKQLFVFDNIEFMLPSLLDDMNPLLDYRDLVDGVDYRQCIFIFISHIGSLQIAKEYEALVESGKKREDIVLRDFEKILAEGVFTDEGAFHNSDVIKNNLIDHYIPFLPLEEEHVTNCIKSIFLSQNVENPQPDHIRNILDTLSWTSTNQTRLSISGCKSIASKVSLLVAKFYESVDNKSEL